MKLSKAQQEVVDKMREGWELKKSNWSSNYWWLSNEASEQFVPNIRLRHTTAKALIELGLIELREKGKTIHEADTYQLTEKYRSNDNSRTID
jgi:hypothetical protein